MQDCSKYDIMLSARLDGTLSKKESRELEKHLAECEDCRKYLQLLETVKDGLREELPDPPELLREGIMYKIGLEKNRKRHFGAFGRWTVIAAVLCVAILGVVKLNGSGVMGSSAAPAEAAPMIQAGSAQRAADASEEENALADSLLESKMTVPAPAPTLTAQLADSAGSGSKAGGAAFDSAPAAASDSGAPEAAYENGIREEPENGSVYTVGSLPGYDAARAALDSGDYCCVCLFYGRLSEGISTQGWQMKIPEAGEKERWELSAGDLQALESGAEWDEFYYGDLDAGLGLVIVIAGEEE